MENDLTVPEAAIEAFAKCLYFKWKRDPLAQLVKNLLAMQETPVRCRGQEGSLEKGYATHSSTLGLPRWLRWQGIHLQCGRPGFNLWVGKIPCRRERLPTPVFWPGQRSLVGYSLWDLKESDTAEWFSLIPISRGKGRLHKEWQWVCLVEGTAAGRDVWGMLNSCLASFCIMYWNKIAGSMR